MLQNSQHHLRKRPPTHHFPLRPAPSGGMQKAIGLEPTHWLTSLNQSTAWRSTPTSTAKKAPPLTPITGITAPAATFSAPPSTLNGPRSSRVCRTALRRHERPKENIAGQNRSGRRRHPRCRPRHRRRTRRIWRNGLLHRPQLQKSLEKTPARPSPHSWPS